MATPMHGTASLRNDQDLHPALMKRYGGRRIAYPALYGCGVPQSAECGAGGCKRRCDEMARP